MYLWKHLNNNNPRTFIIDLLGLFCLLTLTYFLFLGSYPLYNPDEARYAEIAREMVETKQYLVPHLNYILYFEKPALFYWLLALAIKCFGLSEWVVRSWTAILSVMGCLITYTTARMLYDRRTGIYASLILASSFLYFMMGHLVTLDMPLTFFLTASLYCLLLGTKTSLSKPWYYFWLAAVFSALAVLTKGLVGIIFPLCIIGLWVFVQHQWKQLKSWPIFSSLMLFLALTLPWHVMIQLKHPCFFNFYFINQHFARYSTLDSARFEPFYYYFLVMIVGLLPWTFFLPQAFRYCLPTWKNRKNFSTEVFLLIWVVAILLFFSFSHSKLIPYILPIFPPLAIMIGHYFSKASEKNLLGFKLGWSCIPIIGLGMLVFFLMLPNEYDLANPLLAKKFSFILCVVFMVASFLSTACFWKRYYRSAFHVLLIGTLIGLITLLPAIPTIDHNSIKPLIISLKERLKPTDIVINYNRYNQDLPYYLREKITVVNWFTNELAFGIKHQTDTHWMITEKEFWTQWKKKSSERVFVITRLDDLAEILRHHPSFHYYPINKTERNILFSNRP